MAQKSLRQQCAKRVGNDDRRFNEFRQGAAHVPGIVGQRRRAQQVAPFTAAMPANAQRSTRPAAFGGMTHEQLRPHPRAAKGTVDEQDRSAGRPRENRFNEFESRVTPTRDKKPRRHGPAGSFRQKPHESILASFEEFKRRDLRWPEESTAYKLCLDLFPGGPVRPCAGSLAAPR